MDENSDSDEESEDEYQSYSSGPKKYNSRLLHFLFAFGSLPFWTMAWHTDFIFADSGPRTLNAWISGIALFAYCVLTLIAIMKNQERI